MDWITVIAFMLFAAAFATSHIGMSLYCFLLAWMTQTHRPPDRRGSVWDVPLSVLAAFLPLSMFGPLPLPMMDIATPVQETGLLVQLLGLLGMSWSVFALSASFGIEPADRGLVTSGPYRRVRHPQYAFGMLFGLGHVLIEPGWMNVLGWLLMSGAQIVLALREERVIDGYGEYAAQVRWRFIPGVF